MKEKIKEFLSKNSSQIEYIFNEVKIENAVDIKMDEKKLIKTDISNTTTHPVIYLYKHISKI